jgi:hypothetical protein
MLLDPYALENDHHDKEATNLTQSKRKRKLIQLALLNSGLKPAAFETIQYE